MTTTTAAAAAQLTTAARQTVERLEGRTMMSVSAVVDANHTMWIGATGGNDSLHVELNTQTVKVYDTHAKAFGQGAPLVGSWSLTNVKAVSVQAFAGNDTIELGGFHSIPVTLNGGDGNDILIGSEYADSMFGGNGDDNLFGRGGEDFLFGENGNDSLVGDGPNSLIAKDFMSGGAGTDLVSYYYAKAAVTVDLNKLANSGQANEHDIYWNDIENAAGSDFNDVITGNALNNTLWGRKGNDKLNGMNGNDSVFGEDGNDTVTGGAGNDLLVGGHGADQLYASDDSALDTLWGDDKGVFNDASTDTAYVGHAPNNAWDTTAGGIEQTWHVQ